ncbi:MAG: prepilin-type N-terminal cleavage/methylation domain-containing protein [Candidatus Omnitrophica bacterium]|nr:prepilin-type N-terminal cleavage/methylation domain-containing protein [Candidatus Omnitrophota bacterium]
MMEDKGFTLIELLIVVAIIGILAAIAVPNFMNAQIRAKVSRAVSDLKTQETALEMYRLDHNDYPPCDQPRVPGWWDSWHPNEVRLYRLTTPVSYLSSIPHDPFATFANPSDYAQWGFAYDYINNYGSRGHDGGWGHLWRLNSWGPDCVNGWGGSRDFSNASQACPDGTPRFAYSSSNGLTSKGDIVWVGPKDSQCPPNMFCSLQNGI